MLSRNGHKIVEELERENNRKREPSVMDELSNWLKSEEGNTQSNNLASEREIKQIENPSSISVQTQNMNPRRKDVLLAIDDFCGKELRQYHSTGGNEIKQTRSVLRWLRGLYQLLGSDLKIIFGVDRDDVERVIEKTSTIMETLQGFNDRCGTLQRQNNYADALRITQSSQYEWFKRRLIVYKSKCFEISMSIGMATSDYLKQTESRKTVTQTPHKIVYIPDHLGTIFDTEYRKQRSTFYCPLCSVAIDSDSYKHPDLFEQMKQFEQACIEHLTIHGAEGRIG